MRTRHTSEDQRSSFVILICLLGMLLIGFCGRAHGQTPTRFDRVYTASEWTVMAGRTFDAVATQRGLGDGRLREVNALMLRYEQPVPFALAQTAGTVGQLWLTRLLKRHGHPRLALAANFLSGAGFIALGVRNDRIRRGDR